MDVMMLSDRGVPLMCETDGCAQGATSVWSGGWDGKPRRACERHNPMAIVSMPLPVNFTSQSLCHACGQPIQLGSLIR